MRRRLARCEPIREALVTMKKYSDFRGDGGSGILRQVTERKEKIESNLSTLRRRFAIGSGKGGVGKSTLTMLLAQSFRKNGASPVVLDADINGPTQARLAGLGRQLPFPGPDGLEVPVTPDGIGVVSLGTMIPESEAVDFESVAVGDSFVWRATREFTLLADFLASTDFRRFDTLLIDLPPGAERTVQYAEFFGDSTQFVLVTLPSDVSRGVVSRSIAALQKAGNPLLGYIENMAGYYCSDCGQTRRLFPAPSVKLDIECLGRIPFDPRLAQDCDKGLSLSAELSATISERLSEISARLLGGSGDRP